MNPKRPKRYKADRLDTSAITPEIIAEWRAPRFGTTNPQRMNNPLWEWLVRTRESGYRAYERFAYPSPFDSGPAWCFDRMGQSVTALPDGRVILIAGEHEDSYDPDFQIYNDVTVYHPDGTLDLYGYPEDVFPPTDFHTATLIGDRILIVGNLSYCKYPGAGVTQVAELNLKDFSIRLIPSNGSPPGWIHGHTAELGVDLKSIQVRGGLIDPATPESRSLLENPDIYSLDLGTWAWTRLTNHSWERYVFYVEGLRYLPLWQMRGLPFSMDYNSGSNNDPDSEDPSQLVPAEKWEEFQSRFGKTNPSAQHDAAQLYAKGYNPDLEVYAQLYQPDLPHTPIPEPESPEEDPAEEELDENGPFNSDEDDYSTPGDVFEGTRISVNGVIVRYKENMDQVVLTVEGQLLSDTVEFLVANLKRKLEILLNRTVVTKKL